MLWSALKGVKSSQFQRLSGVKPLVFKKMVEVVGQQKALRRKHVSKGRPCKLSVEDQVLMLLMYYREYRSFLHIAMAYCISEAQCWRIITTTEKLLLASQAFHLPGKKKLSENPTFSEVVLIDVAESPIQRPKKNNDVITPVKRSAIP